MTAAPSVFPGFSIAAGGAQAPAAAAAAVTRASASNLWAVGRALPARKGRLFEAAYASMRIIDDFVDDGFLGLGREARAALRGPAHETVDAWLADCRCALAGEAPPARAAADPLAAAGAGPLYAALAAAARDGAPGADAWRALAGAMHRDIDERPLADRADFLGYCEGATVAPAAVFLFVLTARADGADGKRGDGRLASPLDDAALFDRARPMALFCYLVHILRDLARDAARGGQIVTLPADWLAASGIDRDELAADAARAGDGARRLTAILGEEAGRFRAETAAMRDSLAPLLGVRERAVLGALTGVYEMLHDRLTAAPEAALSGDAEAVAGVRAAVFARFGLDDAAP